MHEKFLCINTSSDTPEVSVISIKNKQKASTS